MPVRPIGVTLLAFLFISVSFALLAIPTWSSWTYANMDGRSQSRMDGLMPLMYLIAMGAFSFLFVPVGMLKGWRQAWYVCIIIWVGSILLGVIWVWYILVPRNSLAMTGYGLPPALMLALPVTGFWYFSQQHVKAYFGIAQTTQNNQLENER